MLIINLRNLLNDPSRECEDYIFKFSDEFQDLFKPFGLKFTNLRDDAGFPIQCVNILGNTLIIQGTVQISHNTYEKRSGQIYLDKTHNALFNVLIQFSITNQTQYEKGFLDGQRKGIEDAKEALVNNLFKGL